MTNISFLLKNKVDKKIIIVYTIIHKGVTMKTIINKKGGTMYSYILFKNTRGTTKLNVKLKEPIRSLADLSDIQSNIIFYITENNGYNFILSKEVDTSSVGIHENVFNQYILADFYISR